MGQGTVLFSVTPAAPTWPEPALQPGPKEPLLGYTHHGQPVDCPTGENNTHALCEGRTAWDGRVRKLLQEEASKLRPEHQKFEPGEDLQRGEGSFGRALTVGSLRSQNSTL